MISGIFHKLVREFNVLIYYVIIFIDLAVTDLENRTATLDSEGAFTPEGSLLFYALLYDICTSFLIDWTPDDDSEDLQSPVRGRRFVKFHVIPLVP